MKLLTHLEKLISDFFIKNYYFNIIYIDTN